MTMDESKMLRVEGGEISYQVAGNGTPIILLHEGIADRRMWDREFLLLAREHRVARYDLRGFGRSPPATAPFSSVRDLSDLRDHLRMDRPLIVGPSMGGRIALDLALAEPEGVGGLLLIAPGYSGMDYDHVPGGKATFQRDETLSQNAVDAWKAGDIDQAIEYLRQLWGGALAGSSLDRFRIMVRENATEIFEERSGRLDTREGAPPAASRLHEVRVPTHILVGDRDNPAMPHLANFLGGRIPGATVQLVAGADHLLNLTRPDAFDAAVREVMKNLHRPQGK